MKKTNGSYKGLTHKGPKQKSYQPSLIHIPSRIQRRAIAWLLMVAFFVTFLPLDPGLNFGLPRAKADEHSLATVTIQNSYNSLGGSRAELFLAVRQDFRLLGLANRNLSVDVDPLGADYTLQIISGLNPLTTSMEARIIDGTNPGDIKVDAIESVSISGTPPEGPGVVYTYAGISSPGAPVLLGVEKNQVDAGEDIVIRGNNLGLLLDDEYDVTVGGVPATVVGPVVVLPGGQQSLTLSGNFPNGLVSINVIHTTRRPAYEGATEVGEYTLRTVDNYRNAVRVIANLPLEGITMFPTIGEAGSIVRFTRITMELDGYDVYFLTDLNQAYTTVNKAGDILPLPNNPRLQEDGSFVFSVTVPNVTAGQSYYVVLTPRGETDRRYVMPARYRVVNVGNRPVIERFDPDQASAQQPTTVTISGENFTFIDVPGLAYQVESYTVAPPIPENGAETVTVIYTPAGGTLPHFDLGEETTYEVTALKRSFTVDIGQPLSITSLNPATGNNLVTDNSLEVLTRNITINQETQVSVRMLVTTTITIQDGATTRDLVLEQRIDGDNYRQFTYIPASEAPFVDEVIPSIIPIRPIGGEDYIDDRIQELMVTIKGENFLVSRYQENGLDGVNYPKVRMGDVVIDPNRTDGPGMVPGENIYVPDRYQVLRNGIVVDGVGANEIGNTIVFYLSTGTGGFRVVDRNVSDNDISVLNPRRQSSTFPDDSFFARFLNKVFFREVNQLDFPTIQSVTPNLVALEGGMQIEVVGDNFKPGARVYLEGRLVPNVQIEQNGQRLTFVAPPGQRAGETQLMIVNPEEGGGGLATYPFTYTTTFTQPILTRVNPNEGSIDTLITLEGGNFLRPNPNIQFNDIKLIDAFLMYRLIGTRIFIGGRDINSYNIENNRITLREYHEPATVGGVPMNLPDNVFVPVLDDDSQPTADFQLGRSFDSVIFYQVDPEEKLYRLVRDVEGRYFLEDGQQARYQIIRKLEGGTYDFYARRGSDDFELTQPEKGQLIFDGKTLQAWTPFVVQRIDGQDFITGNRTRYIDGETLRGFVPNMGTASLYDVAAVNPDTREAKLTNAFRFHPSPGRVPRITDIVPELGPDVGGNTITIEGPQVVDDFNGFIESGPGSKTRVFIGGQEVPPANVTVLPNNRQLRVKIPPYPGNVLDKSSSGSLTLPLVLLNPAGGSDYVDHTKPLFVDRTRIVRVDDENVTQTYTARVEGYTYVVPRSNPRLTVLSPTQASGAGRVVININGENFRNFQEILDDEGLVIDRIFADTARTTSRYNPEYQVFTHPLYPQVFFGEQQAEILFYSAGRLEVVIPPGAGTVPVFVVNNDAGISNTLNFQYIASNPVITSVNPDRADRRGGTLVEILGQDFDESMLTLLTGEYYEDDVEYADGVSVRDAVPLTQVRVGRRTNRDLPDTNPNYGRMVGGLATVNLEGGLQVRYDFDTEPLGKLTVTIQDTGVTYRHEYVGFQAGDVVYIDTTDLTGPAPDNTPYRFQELVKIEAVIQQGAPRLIVEGGYAPDVLYRNNRHLVAEMPAYFTTGTVPLTVINPDGGTASRDFVYITPDSSPVITNITREGRDPILEVREGYGTDPIRIQQVSHRGGNVISVYGTDFRTGAGITVGNVVNLPPDAITENLGGTDGDRLTFTMPSLPENTVGSLYRVVVTNVDGGSASSDQARDQDGDVVPLYIEIIKGESDPRLDTVVPAEGPVTGGTRIALTGNDFRRTMEGYETNPISVFFGEQRVEDGSAGFEFVDYRRINVTAPASNTVGLVNIRVENPDGELSLPPGEFRYISQPAIATIEPARIFANDIQRDVTVTGTMFQAGAIVVLGGRLVPEGQEPAGETNHGTGILGVDDNGVNRRFSVVGGVAAVSVTVTNENVLVLNFPEALDLNTNDLIIINPDGGLSDPFADFDYAIPVPDKPLVLEAIPGAEGSVQLIWSKSAPEVLNAADRFEIYGKKSTESQYVFIGDTRDAQHLVRGLALDTRYDFMVRAMNRYGSAIEFAEASTRTLSAAQDPKLGEKVDELDRQQEELETQGKEEIVGNRVIRTVGSREIPVGTTPYVISFAGAQYSRQNEFVVAFPAASLGSMTRPVRITDGTASLTITPSHLLTREVSGLTAAQRRDAVVQVNFTRVQGQDATALVSAMSRTQSRASAPYDISFGLQAGRNQQRLNRLMGSASLSISLDTGTYRSATAANASLTMYDPSRHAFTAVSGTAASFRDPGIYQLTSSR